MKHFLVDDPNQKIKDSFLIEASAGTGKTYSIENLILRALLEEDENGDSLKLSEILVVTFTKLSANDLKERIYKRLKKGLLETTETRKKRKINLALAEFEKASISTIHSFCFQGLKEEGLESGTLLRLTTGPEELSKDLLYETVEDYFRTELKNDELGTAQLKILLKAHQYKVKDLIDALLKTIQRGIEISEGIDQEEAVKQLKKYESIKTDLIKNAINFYGLTTTKKTLKEEFLIPITEFYSLAHIEETANFFRLFRKENLKKTAKPDSDLNHLLNTVENEVTQLVFALGTYSTIFLNLASKIQKKIWTLFESNDLADFSYLLRKFHSVLENSKTFKERIQKRYKMAIIDEFQDTDPLQWAIFKTLFGKPPHHLILVGDPKQSIYSFRSADVYTYYEAASSFKEENRYILATNYRSSKPLIDALNGFFNTKRAHQWMPLPEIKKQVPYIPVLHAPSKENEPGLMQFFGVNAIQEEKVLNLSEIEEKFLFPRFLLEIHLLRKMKINLKDIAILVRDHLQGTRVHQFLKSHRIPSFQKKGELFFEADCYLPILYLLRALLNPRTLSTLQIALGTPYFNFSWQELKLLENPLYLAEMLNTFLTWQKIWKEKGVASLYTYLMEERSLNNATIKEKILEKEDGLDWLQKTREIFEWLSYKEQEKNLTPHQLLIELEELQIGASDVDESIKFKTTSTEDAISILTLHMSKGLEFEAVFALGVINRTPVKGEIFPCKTKEGLVLKAIQKETLSYLKAQEESDAEKARQLYVALTRAKKWLYIPIISGWKTPSFGAASALELFIARLYNENPSWEALYENMEVPFELIQKLIAEENLASLKFEELKGMTLNNEHFEEEKPLLIPPKSIQLSFKNRTSYSFSSIATLLKQERDEEHKPKSGSSNSLPAGAKTGVFLHTLLEEIPLPFTFSDDELLNFIEKKGKNNALLPYKTEIFEMLKKALTIPLKDSSIILGNLCEGSYFKEVEFLTTSSLNELGLQEGLMKGFIDLFFEHKGKYYLLDWKSNLLPSYDETNLLKSMDDGLYHIQANIYKDAVRKYLNIVEKNEFEMCFGGIFYLYLRGFDGENGVLWIK